MTVSFHPNGLRVIDQSVLDDVTRRVVSAFDPNRITVFGSIARGDASPDSDLDLFIEMDSDLSPVERSVAVRRVLRDVAVPMDIFVMTPGEVEAHQGKVGDLLSFVNAEGRVLYERR